MNKIKD